MKFKIQKSTFAGLALILGTLAAVFTGFAGGEDAPAFYGTISQIAKYVLPMFGSALIAADGGKPSI